MPNSWGRSVIQILTNKSGGAVAAGDVVVIDTGNNDAFTTTTSGRAEISVGVAQETIANNVAGRVLVAGYAALINVPASVTRGHYIETHTVVKQATGNSTRRSGSFGQFPTGGATPTGWLWGQTDQTASSASLPALSGTAVYNSAAQVVSAATEYTATFDTETFDTGGYHEGVTNPGRITIPTGKDGYYIVRAKIYHGGTPGSSYAYLRKNGTTAINGSENDSNAAPHALTPGAVVALVATDYLEVRAFRTTGTSSGNATGAASNLFEAVLIGT